MQEDKTKTLALDKLHNKFGIKGDLFGFQEECIMRIVKDRLDTFCIRKTDTDTLLSILLIKGETVCLI